MYRLILFFQRHTLFFFFLLLESLSLYLVVQNNSFHRAGFLNSSNEVVGKMYQNIAELKEYFLLRERMDTLLAENAELRSKVLESYYINFADTILVNDTNLHQQFTYIPAKVINNSVTGKNNYMTINKGSDHGIEEQMGVISPEGVVGIVHHVSKHFCTVVSVLNQKNMKMSAKIVDNNNFGSLEWDGRDPRYAVLENINQEVKVVVGQLVSTTSHSTIFPENIKIGWVDTYVKENNFYSIKVRLSVDFSNISSVYIVQNNLKREIEAIDSLERISN
jgi:rod shape-determining protein MreC